MSEDIESKPAYLFNIQLDHTLNIEGIYSLNLKAVSMGIAIVIQGPQNPASVSSRYIRYYSQLGLVVVSCWKGDSPPLADFLVFNDPTVPNGTYNNQNLYYQCLSTHSGLKKAFEEGKEFCLKVRSDQGYGNLRPILDKMLNNPYKFITSNQMFRRDCLKFHPSDHMIGGMTERMLAGFSLLKERLERHEISKPWGYNAGGTLFAEQAIAAALLEANGTETVPEISKQIMRNNFDLVPCHLLDFKWAKGGLVPIDRAIQSMDDIEPLPR